MSSETVSLTESQTDSIKVLDKGYVRLVDTMGSDLSVVNAARVSYDKESNDFNDKDERLVKFLVRERHTAPFRHAVATFEVYAPLFVARQWWKHIVGGQQNEIPQDPFLAWNESSRRYVTENEEFYVPTKSQWRTKPENNKQGSGENAIDILGNIFTMNLDDHISRGVELYQRAMNMGIAPEQARLFLSANSLYVRWRWTTSLQGVVHFVQLRDESHAQFEIQEYARAVKQLTTTKFPVSMDF